MLIPILFQVMSTPCFSGSVAPPLFLGEVAPVLQVSRMQRAGQQTGHRQQELGGARVRGPGAADPQHHGGAAERRLRRPGDRGARGTSPPPQ